MTSRFNMETLIPTGKIEQTILLIRGKRVMIDADLARVYGVSTKRLNEQVKRNKARFPENFMFKLDPHEKDEVVANCDHLKHIKFSHQTPYVFTEHGAVMLASVLNSPIAIKASIHVVQAFVNLQEIVSTHKNLAHKLASLEKKYDSQFTKQIHNFCTINRPVSTEQLCCLLVLKVQLLSEIVFDAIRQLMTPPKKEKRKIGF